MGMVETLKDGARALVRTAADPSTAEGWREKIAAISQKRDAAQQRLSNNGAQRNQLALVAAQGDPDAQSALDITSADHHALQLALDNLDRALAQARKNLANAEAAEAAAARKAMLDRHAKHLRDRTELARTIEGTLRALARQVGELAEVTERGRRSFNAATQNEPQRALIDGPLEHEALASALVLYMHSLGLARHLGVNVPELAPRVDSLVERIHEQNRRVELTAAGKARVLHPEPPEAA